MSSNTGIIIAREVSERVRKKSFIFTTILMPILILCLMIVPGAIVYFSAPSGKNIVVIDKSGSVAPMLEDGETVTFSSVDIPLDSAKRLQDIFAILFIPADVMTNDNAQLELYTNGTSSMIVESIITDQVNKLVENERLKSYNIENLNQILEKVKSNVRLKTTKIDDETNSEEISTAISFALGIALTFFLYTIILLYGQMVCNSIIEEKANRVLEIIVSSVKPTQLMIGKICGIGLVAFIQMIIWGIFLSVLSLVVLPMILPESISMELSAYNTGMLDMNSAETSAEMLQALSLMSDMSFIFSIFAFMTLFLIGGFFLYASIFAAIGSAVDNIQDASQLQTIATFPVIFALIIGMMAANDPDSAIALWGSMIPFTSPVVMMARIPFGVPTWQIVTSLVLLVGGFLVMVWIAAKIYRVGIFMHGKKPTIKDLIRWMRYK